MAREKFTFRRAWIDGWEDMSAAERLEYMEAIVRYGLTGTRRAMSHYVRGRMVAVMRDVDEDRRKEEAITCVRREAGRLGGKQKQANLANASKGKQKQANLANANAPYIKETRVPAHPQAYTEGVSSSLRSEDTRVVDVVVVDNSGVNAANNNDDNIFSSLCTLWNEAVKANGASMRPIRAIVPGTKRHKKVEALVKQYGAQAVKEAIGEAANSEYINGQNSIGWVATFDWFVQPDNFQKVLEGNFQELRGKCKPKPSAPSSEPTESNQPTRPQIPREMLEAWERVKQSCERALGAQFRRTFLDYCCPWAREGSKVQIAVPTSFVREKLTEQAGTLLAAARREWGAEVQIWLTVVRGLDRMCKE